MTAKKKKIKPTAIDGNKLSTEQTGMLIMNGLATGRNIMVTIVKYREDGLVDWAFELLTEEAYENYKPPKGYVIKDIKKLYFKDQVKHI